MEEIAFRDAAWILVSGRGENSRLHIFVVQRCVKLRSLWWLGGVGS